LCDLITPEHGIPLLALCLVPNLEQLLFARQSVNMIKRHVCVSGH